MLKIKELENYVEDDARPRGDPNHKNRIRNDGKAQAIAEKIISPMSAMSKPLKKFSRLLLISPSASRFSTKLSLDVSSIRRQ